jgi:hypothetical protein
MCQDNVDSDISYYVYVYIYIYTYSRVRSVYLQKTMSGDLLVRATRLLFPQRAYSVKNFAPPERCDSVCVCVCVCVYERGVIYVS